VNILFICSKNKWRSRTAETIFKDSRGHDVRSAGTVNDARIRVTEKLIDWSDLIFVMEKHHKEKLQQRFGQLLDDKEIVILDITDDYQYMDEELIETLKVSVSPYVTF
jgi:protein-tyrosine phosphatase